MTPGFPPHPVFRELNEPTQRIVLDELRKKYTPPSEAESGPLTAWTVTFHIPNGDLTVCKNARLGTESETATCPEEGDNLVIQLLKRVANQDDKLKEAADLLEGQQKRMDEMKPFLSPQPSAKPKRLQR